MARLQGRQPKVIYGHEFEFVFPIKYEEEHVLKRIEAAAPQQTWMENLVNKTNKHANDANDPNPTRWRLKKRVRGS